MSHTETTTAITEQPQQSEADRVQLPDPEVVLKAQRRQYSATYKLRVLQEVAACTEPGQIGALLRQEGLYSSHLNRWRQQLERSQLVGLTPHQRGRSRNGQATELARLRQENEQLQRRLQQAELVVEVQKKLSQLLGLSSQPSKTDENR